MNMGDNREVVLRNLVVKPGHEEAFLTAWQGRGAFDQSNGVEVIDAYFETGPGVIYDLAAGEIRDPGGSRIFTWLSAGGEDLEPSWIGELREHVIDDSGPHHVQPEALTAPADITFSKMTVMRRYQIQGDWDEFLVIWRRIAALRERHEFHILFAVGDRQLQTFTWGFTAEGSDFQHFLSEGQMEYYKDPERIELETINAYLKEIALTPSRRIALS
jgi:hypothetical protein